MSARRRNIMLGTAGHVDHGKTAVVKLLTGCETDTLAEEKQRGLTIDLGFAPCRLADDRIIGVVDVPGHVDFIRNMVAGAHGIDVVIFVVAADDGVMPQTREHLHILSLMGLRHGLVALTKIDLVDAEMRAVVIEDVRTLLAGTFLERAPVCPISTLSGEGFEGMFDALNDVVNGCEDRSDAGLFHMWVEDVFTIRGAGTVITGIPTRGRARLNDRLCVQPGEKTGRVRGLQVYGETADEGRAGECVAINLADVDHHGIHRGMVLCEPGALSPVSRIEAELRLLPAAKGEWKNFSEVHFHIGTAAIQARLALLERPLISPGEKQMIQLSLAEPLCIVPGERFVIRANTKGAGQSSLATIGGGRVVGVSNARIRRVGTIQSGEGTLALTPALSPGRNDSVGRDARPRPGLLPRGEGVRIESSRTFERSLIPPSAATSSPSPIGWERAGPRAVPNPTESLQRTKSSTIEDLTERRDAIDDPVAWCEVVLKQSTAPLTTEALGQSCVLRPEEVECIAAGLNSKGSAIRTASGRWLHPTRIEAAASQVFDRIQSFHVAEPARLGIESKALLAALKLDSELFEMAVKSLVAGGKIENRGPLLAKAGWNVRISSDEETLGERLASILQKAGWAVPVTAELVAATMKPQPQVEASLRLLVERGTVVKLGDGLFMHRDAIAAARQVATRLFEKAPSFSTMEFRDALAVSRKFAVPILDYLDARRFTVRNGNQRTPGVEARQALKTE